MSHRTVLLTLYLVSTFCIAEPTLLTLAHSQYESQRMMQYYRAQASQGDAHAQFKVGYAYEVGDGLPQDEASASIWYQRAARQGHKNAILNLAAMDKADQPYLDSEIEYQNSLTFAAQEGDIDARHQLAKMLINNVLYEPDRQQIFSWVQQLASAKHRESQYILGQMYEMGVSVPQNFILAYAWYSIAAAAGDDRAQFNRDALAEKMSSQQLEQGQVRSMQLFEQMS